MDVCCLKADSSDIQILVFQNTGMIDENATHKTKEK